MSKPSVIFMGSKPGASVALSLLIKSGWDVKSVVVTKEDYQPWVPGVSIRDCAEEHGLPVFTQSQLKDTGPVDFVISYMYRNLVVSQVLAMAKIAAVNFHAAPLPELGGFACYNRAVLEQLEAFGVSCHYMDGGFDTGDLCMVRRYAIEHSCETAVSVERRAQLEMIQLFIDFCKLAESGQKLPRSPQNLSLREYIKESQLDEMKRIPADADADTIDRYARAFWYPPYSGAYLMHNDVRVEVFPRNVATQLACALHQDDYARLSELAAAQG